MEILKVYKLSREWIIKDLGIGRRTLQRYLSDYCIPLLGPRLGFVRGMDKFTMPQYHAIKLVHKILNTRSLRWHRKDGSVMTGQETVTAFIETVRMDWNTGKMLEEQNEVHRIA